MNKNFVWGEVRALPEGESREVTFVASDSTRDRHKTVLNPERWDIENFNRNPITGYMHNLYGDMCNPPDPDDVLGPARAWIDNNELLVTIDFEPRDLNPKADKIFRKIQNGSLRAVSVGFIEIGKGKYGQKDEARGGKNETYYFDAQELFEVSVVNIPSNPKAVKKSLRYNTTDALAFLVKAFGDKISLSDLDNMKVCEIRKLLSDDNELFEQDAEADDQANIQSGGDGGRGGEEKADEEAKEAAKAEIINKIDYYLKGKK